MNTCNRCGAEYDDACYHDEDGTTSKNSYEDEVNAYIAENEKFLPVTRADKLFGFGSLCGILISIIYIIVFAYTVSEPELEMFFLAIIAVFFLVSVVCALFPKVVWLLKLYRISFSPRFGGIQPLFGLYATRKFIGRAISFLTLLALIAMMIHYPHACNRPSREDIAERMRNEMLQELLDEHGLK